MKKAHQVTVLGRELPVRSSAPVEKIKEVESFVNNMLHEIGAALRSGDAQLVLTLALLNTAEELLDLRKSAKPDADLNDRIVGMIRQVDKV
jgi:cell division protein ZapA (FtsZ GTPase activity inhibitor)